MKIDSLKDLQKLIQLCRKLGVDAIEIDNVKMNLGPVPNASYMPRKRSKTASTEVDATPDRIETDDLTDEQKLFYSAVPHGDFGDQ